MSTMPATVQERISVPAQAAPRARDVGPPDVGAPGRSHGLGCVLQARRCAGPAGRSPGGSGKMARSEDKTMKNFRKIRRQMNARLAKAESEGRLAKEFEKIEGAGLKRWREIEGSGSKARRRRAAK